MSGDQNPPRGHRSDGDAAASALLSRRSGSKTVRRRSGRAHLHHRLGSLLLEETAAEPTICVDAFRRGAGAFGRGCSRNCASCGLASARYPRWRRWRGLSDRSATRCSSPPRKSTSSSSNGRAPCSQSAEVRPQSTKSSSKSCVCSSHRLKRNATAQALDGSSNRSRASSRSRRQSRSRSRISTPSSTLDRRSPPSAMHSGTCRRTRLRLSQRRKKRRDRRWSRPSFGRERRSVRLFELGVDHVALLT
jgi:hypothetical protein